MKRTIALVLGLLLISALSLAIFTGCSKEEAQVPSETQAATETAAQSEGKAVTVSNVDDFLAAIAPGADITLAEGTFDLSTAADYGSADAGTYYHWEATEDGFTLVLQDVEGLSIRGAEKGSEIVATGRTADVLLLRGCKNVSIANLRMGHTEAPGACVGHVIALDRSEDIRMGALNLYGCGATGLDMDQCKNIALLNSNIFSCTYSAVNARSSSDITLEDCSVDHIGYENGAPFLFYFGSCDGVTVTECFIFDNNVNYLVSAYDSSNLSISNSAFTSNQTTMAAFMLSNTDLTITDTTYDYNIIHNWYEAGSDHALDGNGQELIFEEPEAAPVEPAVATPVSTGNQKQVRVKTVDEFLAAIDSDTEIILEAELLDFSEATGYGTAQGEHYYWEEEFDGPNLVITDVENLTIKAEGDDIKAHTLSAVPRYAHVLTFENCSAITVTGFTAGHTKEPGSCVGGVLLFRDSEKCLVENCGLYGCGVLGVWTRSCEDIQIINNDIYECSNGGIELNQSRNITIGGNTFRDLGGPTFKCYGSENVTINGSPVDGNYIGE
ncbi:MAG TPA: right-handed parallel beta-helix repeat-containing protein [Candidatus Faecousia faecipullorum]|nr:right-handed parallel beta-helix repeat-containing protein [Candidatus Faecousia faecipullorum]